MPKKTSVAPGRSGRSSPRLPSRLVICAGLKSSGSTWLYNVVAEILKRAKRRAAGRSVRIAQFYADTIDTFPKQAEYASDLVVKTHIPSRSLQFLITVAAGRVLLTVRDPRDAIA